MKDEAEENILLMGSFTLCPRSNSTMLVNGCVDCDYFASNEGKYLCTYDEESDEETIRLVDFITMLLELVEAGTTRIKKSELVDLLMPGDE